MTKVYTDGSCYPNPGPGSWAIVVVRDGSVIGTLSRYEGETTNNRMELTAAIKALTCTPIEWETTIVTDSQYVKNGVEKWSKDWVKYGWTTSSGGAVKNQDLWQALLAACDGRKVTWAWTRGHDNDKYNELADKLCTEARVNGGSRDRQT